MKDEEVEHDTYNAFAKDAILIIYNVKGIKDVPLNGFGVLRNDIKNLYINQIYYYYDNIFSKTNLTRGRDD